MNKYLLLLLLLAGFQCAHAQNYFGLLHQAKQTGQFHIAASPSLQLGWDYLISFAGIQLKNRPVGWGASLSMPLFSQEGLDIDFSAGAGYLLPLKNKIQLLTGVKYGFYRTQDINARYINHGIKLDVFPGYYGSKWLFAAHFAIDYRPFVHIRHRAYAKQAFQDLYPHGNGPYTAPQNGWFTQNMRFGSYGICVAYRQEKWHVRMVIDYHCPLTGLGYKIIPELGMMPFNAYAAFCYLISR
jgi:hypothetical protein